MASGKAVRIEPLAFIAILALYIEFPSIQDLIYTKICLQVVASQPATQFNGTLFFDSAGEHAPTRDHFLCDRLNKSAIPSEIRQEISTIDSLFWLRYQVIICLLCAISCPYWGGMSDHIGRLIPLNVPIVMAVISNMISLIFSLLINLNSHAMFRVEWLYLSAVLVGISGGQSVIIISSFSFISDNTSSESRSKQVAVLESVIYLAHSVGFLLAKYIMTLGLSSSERPWLNRHFVAFSLTVALNLICILYSVFKLRHHKFHRFLNNFEREQQEAFAGNVTSPANQSAKVGKIKPVQGDPAAVFTTVASGLGVANTDRTRDLTSSTPDDLDGPIARADKRLNNCGALLTIEYYRQTYETTMKQRESRPLILLLLLSGFISAMCLTSLMSLLYIYLHDEPFNWTTSQYSSWNSITSITRGVALVAFTVSIKFAKSWNIPDPLVAAIGFLSKGIGLLMIALAQTSSIINWALLAFVLSEYSMPPIRSLLSKLVIKEEVAKIYSCLAVLQSICFLFGNMAFYVAYNSIGPQHFFRFCFLIVAAFQFAAVIIMLFIYTILRRRVVIM